MIWHRNGNRLTKQDALRKLNKTVSDKIEEIQRGGEMMIDISSFEGFCVCIGFGVVGFVAGYTIRVMQTFEGCLVIDNRGKP